MTLKWAAAEFQEFAAVSRGIWQMAPWNLAKFAVENCGPYLSVQCTKYCRVPVFKVVDVVLNILVNN